MHLQGDRLMDYSIHFFIGCIVGGVVSGLVISFFNWTSKGKGNAQKDNDKIG